jgi:hypothetical protein
MRASAAMNMFQQSRGAVQVIRLRNSCRIERLVVRVPPSALIFRDQKSVASARSFEEIVHEASTFSNRLEYGESWASLAGGEPA